MLRLLVTTLDLVLAFFVGINIFQTKGLQQKFDIAFVILFVLNIMLLWRL